MMIGDKFDPFHDTDIKRMGRPFLGGDLGRDDSGFLEGEKEEENLITTGLFFESTLNMQDERGVWR